MNKCKFSSLQPIAAPMLLASLMLVTGCDSDAEHRWQKIAIGGTRESALQVMGTAPTSTFGVEYPLGISAERLIWRGRFGLGGNYTVDLVFGRVVAKGKAS